MLKENFDGIPHKYLYLPMTVLTSPLHEDREQFLECTHHPYETLRLMNL